MGILVTILHVLVCVFLVIVVLLQSGKAADLAGAFGGMGSQTAFGPRGAATVLSKATTIAAGLFMLTSLTLAILTTRNAGAGTSVLERTSAPAKQNAPAQPGNAGQQPSATPTPAAPADPSKQPMVEFKNERGDVVGRQPIDVNQLPRVQPNAPAQPPPGKK
jgi:preprotein translocase subunit SecG